jgi:hypothetical protein
VVSPELIAAWMLVMVASSTWNCAGASAAGLAASLRAQPVAVSAHSMARVKGFVIIASSKTVAAGCD